MWTPRHSHVTQIHPADGSGQNDCFEASLARYLYEAGLVPADRDPWDLINEISVIARGTPDTPANADTTLAQADAAIAHYGLPVQWTSSYDQALAAPWAICLVNGVKLAPAQYPASWFGGANWPDHFILWLPLLRGADNWFDDPLAYNNGQLDCQYDLWSVASAFGGAYLLPAVADETGSGRVRVLAACALKSQPNHTSVALANIPAGGQALDRKQAAPGDGATWEYIQWRDRYGWVLKSNLAAL